MFSHKHHIFQLTKMFIAFLIHEVKCVQSVKKRLEKFDHILGISPGFKKVIKQVSYLQIYTYQIADIQVQSTLDTTVKLVNF